MDPKTIRTRLQELAFLNSEATIWLRAPPGHSADSNGAAASSAASNGADHPADDGWEKLHFSGGLKEYVAFLNRDSQPMHDPIYITEKVCTQR